MVQRTFHSPSQLSLNSYPAVCITTMREEFNLSLLQTERRMQLVAAEAQDLVLCSLSEKEAHHHHRH